MNRLDKQDTFNFAVLLCQKLALDLDANDTSAIDSTAFFLDQLDTEILLITVRSLIQLDRIIRMGLDEHPVFAKILIRINQAPIE